MATLVYYVIQALTLAIFASVIFSWLPLVGVRVPQYHPVVQVIEQTAGLIVNPIRRLMRTTAGGMDFSPLIALLLLRIVGKILVRALAQLPI